VNQFHSEKLLCIDEDNPYFKMLHTSWGDKLRQVFDDIDDPLWHGEKSNTPILNSHSVNNSLKKISSPHEKLI
jgi:putative proteasome-type protease